VSPSWIIGQDGEIELRAMYERHYSCYHYKDGRRPAKFVGPFESIVLTTPRRDALFVWTAPKAEFKDDEQTGINCAVFRNEGKTLSSNLIREADAIADFCWPRQRHYTTVCAEAVTSRNPGWCFICAGWVRCGTTKGGLVILERLKLELCETTQTKEQP
jgi:hypothetical protein